MPGQLNSVNHTGIWNQRSETNDHYYWDLKLIEVRQKAKDIWKALRLSI